MTGLPIFDKNEKLSLEEIKERIKDVVKNIFEKQDLFDKCHTFNCGDRGCEFLIPYPELMWKEICKYKEGDTIKDIVLTYEYTISNNVGGDTEMYRVVSGAQNYDFNHDKVDELIIDILLNVSSEMVYKFLNEDNDDLEIDNCKYRIYITKEFTEEDRQLYREMFKPFVVEYHQDINMNLDDSTNDLNNFKNVVSNLIGATILGAEYVSCQSKRYIYYIDNIRATAILYTDKGVLIFETTDYCCGSAILTDSDEELKRLIGQKIVSMEVSVVDKDYYHNSYWYQIETQKDYATLRFESWSNYGKGMNVFFLTNEQFVLANKETCKGYEDYKVTIGINDNENEMN